jgi:hypothetical protein
MPWWVGCLLELPSLWRRDSFHLRDRSSIVSAYRLEIRAVVLVGISIAGTYLTAIAAI